MASAGQFALPQFFARTRKLEQSVPTRSHVSLELCFEHLIKEVHVSSAILNNAPPQLELVGDSRSHGEANRKDT